MVGTTIDRGKVKIYKEMKDTIADMIVCNAVFCKGRVKVLNPKNGLHVKHHKLKMDYNELFCNTIRISNGSPCPST